MFSIPFFLKQKKCHPYKLILIIVLTLYWNLNWSNFCIYAITWCLPILWVSHWHSELLQEGLMGTLLPLDMISQSKFPSLFGYGLSMCFNSDFKGTASFCLAAIFTWSRILNAVFHQILLREVNSSYKELYCH